MKKRLLVCVLGLSIALAGCGSADKADKEPETVRDEAAETDDTENTTTDDADTEKEDVTPEETPEEATPEATETQQATISAEALSAYEAALTTLYNEHVLPDGSDNGYYEGDETGNNFLIYDIDGDGRKELTINYTTTYMAGMVAAIYEYNEQSGQLRNEFQEFPALTFYDNGKIRADWSHNQGYAGNFWPFTLYEYNEIRDAYVAVAAIDAWDQSIFPDSYPDDVDVSGTGFVYYIIVDGTGSNNPLDASVYNEWRDTNIGDAAPLQLDFQTLNPENIASAVAAE